LGELSTDTQAKEHSNSEYNLPVVMTALWRFEVLNLTCLKHPRLFQSHAATPYVNSRDHFKKGNIKVSLMVGRSRKVYFAKDHSPYTTVMSLLIIRSPLAYSKKEQPLFQLFGSPTEYPNVHLCSAAGNARDIILAFAATI